MGFDFWWFWWGWCDVKRAIEQCFFLLLCVKRFCASLRDGSGRWALVLVSAARRRQTEVLETGTRYLGTRHLGSINRINRTSVNWYPQSSGGHQPPPPSFQRPPRSASLIGPAVGSASSPAQTPVMASCRMAATLAGTWAAAWAATWAATWAGWQDARSTTCHPLAESTSQPISSSYQSIHRSSYPIVVPGRSF